MIKQKALLIGAKRFDFTDKETGKKVSGTNVFYSTLSESETDKNEDLLGTTPKKARMSYEYYGNLQKISFPHLVEVEFSINMDSDKMKLEEVSFKPLKDIPSLV